MNLSLIDPFVLAQDYPDTLTEKLSRLPPCYIVGNLLIMIGSGHATCLRFNRKGDYLASGRVRFQSTQDRNPKLTGDIR